MLLFKLAQVDQCSLSPTNVAVRRKQVARPLQMTLTLIDSGSADAIVQGAISVASRTTIQTTRLGMFRFARVKTVLVHLAAEPWTCVEQLPLKNFTASLHLHRLMLSALFAEPTQPSLPKFARVAILCFVRGSAFPFAASEGGRGGAQSSLVRRSSTEKEDEGG